jgi:hypothetical protein
MASIRAAATAGLLRLLDKWRPARPLSPHEIFQHRFLVGGLHLGLLVGLFSLAMTLAGGTRLGAVMITVMVLALAGLLAGARMGLTLRALGWSCVLLVGAFLALTSLITRELQPDQIYWLVLLPLIARVLHESADIDPERRRSPVLWATALAMALGAFVVVAHARGLTFGRLTPPFSSADRIADHAVFIAAVTGLVALYDLALRSAEDELVLLRRLLSVCAWCKKIRAGDDRWIAIEEYLTQRIPVGRSGPQEHGRERGLSHGICPTCLAEHFPEG